MSWSMPLTEVLHELHQPPQRGEEGIHVKRERDQIHVVHAPAHDQQAHRHSDENKQNQ